MLRRRGAGAKVRELPQWKLDMLADRQPADRQDDRELAAAAATCAASASAASASASAASAASAAAAADDDDDDVDLSAYDLGESPGAGPSEADDDSGQGAMAASIAAARAAADAQRVEAAAAREVAVGYHDLDRPEAAVDDDPLFVADGPAPVVLDATSREERGELGLCMALLRGEKPPPAKRPRGAGGAGTAGAAAGSSAAPPGEPLPLDASSKGHQMLRALGWKAGDNLGAQPDDAAPPALPVSDTLVAQFHRRGLGAQGGGARSRGGGAATASSAGAPRWQHGGVQRGLGLP